LFEEQGGRGMHRVTLAISFLFLMANAPAFGQLGPKDGSKLPPTDLQRIQVGQPAPDFTLENVDGRQISLSDYRGQQSVVLVFYRGQW
jgi:cytochrome oxidase Cu insertion factor (SCO1/SenC/PrrC family)